MDRKRVKPLPGKILRDERRGLIPEEGKIVDVSSPYWRRRMRDGDCVVEDAKAPASAPTLQPTDEGGEE